ncbi:carbohydrate porin [Pseudoxanthomonas winnipegensis]|uniref:carbohydrate porin n=1 Tax=Pseudoxanthomonas winnipegensis TaxID=2480810 RepID=UPI0013EE60B0|nr:carbohydrate porin [Pseudoxanthomonas winnipegensis]
MRPRAMPAGALLLATTVLGGTGVAHAADGDNEAAAGSAQTTAAPDPKFALFDRFMEQGLLVKMPPSRDTIAKDAWGLRSALAEHDIGIQFLSLNSSAYDLHAPRTQGPQRYNGENLSGMSTQQVLVTYNFDPQGDDQKQLIFGAVNTLASWEPLGPRAKISLSRLAYYQSFNRKQWELKIGYLSNALEYVGIYTGGSLAGGTQGLNSVIPFQVGMSRLPFASPGMNLQYNGRNEFYNKFGIQRSISPRGSQAEIENNEHGFRWRTPDAGTLLIDELGVKRPATQNTRYLWLRAGAIHNSSDYRRMDGRGESDDNDAYYAAADVQLTRSESAVVPSQGWNLGATYNVAPSDRNLYTEYFEARLYKLGTFRRRPFDMLAFNVNRTEFSEEARAAYAARSIPTAHYMDAATVSYMARVHAGTYLSTALSHVSNPTFSPKHDDALNLLVSLNLFF